MDLVARIEGLDEVWFEVWVGDAPSHVRISSIKDVISDPVLRDKVLALKPGEYLYVNLQIVSEVNNG